LTLNSSSSNREAVVQEFHEVFGQAVDTEWTPELLQLRINLIMEESQEILEELFDYKTEEWIPVSKVSKVRVLKEMADLQYVLSGMAVALGLPLEEGFLRVHKSNMSKLDHFGKPVYRSDGKVLKGPNYTPAVMDDLT
jgi:predicted HAD superfamily Cof-like phosphohydrolase